MIRKPVFEFTENNPYPTNDELIGWIEIEIESCLKTIKRSKGSKTMFDHMNAKIDHLYGPIITALSNPEKSLKEK